MFQKQPKQANKQTLVQNISKTKHLQTSTKTSKTKQKISTSKQLQKKHAKQTKKTQINASFTKYLKTKQNIGKQTIKKNLQL